MELFLYTDGSCSPNPGPGGAGAVFVITGADGSEWEICTIKHCGGSNTSNNKMELSALIMIFKYIPKWCQTTVFTDSRYVVEGIHNWSTKWIANGWRTATNKSVQNCDLWKRLIELKNDYPNVEIKWIKAHNNHKWNDYADKLANDGAKICKNP